MPGLLVWFLVTSCPAGKREGALEELSNEGLRRAALLECRPRGDSACPLQAL